MVKLRLIWQGTCMESLRQLICALRGHEDYLRFERNRMYLQCIACGYESPGWTIDARRPVLRFQARRAQPSGHDLMRKIA